MDCPVCKVPMIVVEHDRIELDYCLDCRGLWFDAEELEMLLASLDLAANLPEIDTLPRAETDEKPRRCPRCAKKMLKVMMGREPGVVIDRCSRGHGLWFDVGELGDVVRQHLTPSGSGEESVVRFLGEALMGPKGEEDQNTRKET